MPSTGVVRELFLHADRDPVAAGVQVGDLVFLPRIAGIDPLTGVPADGVRAQLDQALRNVNAVLATAGLTPENIGRVTVFSPDLSDRDALEEPWMTAYPAYNDRPARKMMRLRRPEEQVVQIEVLAVVDGRRQLLTIPGHTGHDPSIRIGRYVFSSRIPGTEPETGRRGDDAAEQTRFAFRNIKNLVEAAGGTTDNVTQLTFFTREPGLHGLATEPWQQMFPDAARRPVLHTVTADLSGPNAIMLEAVAVL